MGGRWVGVGFAPKNACRVVPVQEGGEPAGQRENIWNFFRMRFGYEKAEQLKSHFEKHEKEEGLEAAYGCLTNGLISVMESMHASISVHTFAAKWLLKFGTEDADD